MAYDIAISDKGDLLFAGNRDLAGVSGTDLLEQRIRVRLRLHRGEWIYDTDGTIGSNLFRLIGKPPDAVAQAAPAYVREALRGMDEISIDNILTDTSDGDLTITVLYRVLVTADAASGGNATEEQFSISVTLSNANALGGVE